MKFALKVLRGFLIGCSMIIPGVSGGTMAVSMGIYDTLIDFVTVSGSMKKRFISLLPYICGLLLGIAAFSFFVERMFAAYPLQTAFLFTGLILGALPMLIKKVKGERMGLRHAVALLAVIALMIYLPITSKNAGSAFALNGSFIHIMLCFALGFVTAATMVMPGVSGSMILMVAGYYEAVIQSVNSFTSALLTLNFVGMLSYFSILLPFSLGAIFGVIVMSRVIRILLMRFPYTAYYMIIGLVAASPIAVLYQQSFIDVPGMTYALCGIMLLAGFFAAIGLGLEDKTDSH